MNNFLRYPATITYTFDNTYATHRCARHTKGFEHALYTLRMPEPVKSEAVKGVQCERCLEEVAKMNDNDKTVAQFEREYKVMPDSGIDLDYLITIGKGGENGVMSLLKTPEDHAIWERNIRWFASALASMPQAAQPVAIPDGWAEAIRNAALEEAAQPVAIPDGWAEAIRNAALEEAAQAIWQYKADSTISPSLMHDITGICKLVRALQSPPISKEPLQTAPLRIEVCPDGVWLKFKGGRVRLNSIAEDRGPIVRRALLAALAEMQSDKGEIS